MTWRAGIVSIALLASIAFGATLAGGVFAVPSHADHLGSNAPDGWPAAPSDIEPLPTAMAASRQAVVSTGSSVVDSHPETAVATVPTIEYRDGSTIAKSVIQSVLDPQMTYPAEDEPDGNRWLPHHGLWALGLYVVGWYYWHAGGAPVFGATLVGLAVLLLLDDWISHALGLKTPGDTAFEWLMRRRAFRRMYIRLWWIIYR